MSRTAETRALAAELAVAEQEERHRLAHVLHDDLQQQLYAVGVSLDLLVGRMKGPDDDDLLAKAQEVLQHALELTRSLATELSPPILDGAELAPILDWIVDRKERMYGLRVQVTQPARCEVSPYPLRVTLVQAVREVLFNVVKHAGVKVAYVDVAIEGDALRVTVRDEGIGFVPTSLRRTANRVGLSATAERLALLGGSLVIDSAPGAGTRVVLTVPAPHGSPPSLRPDRPT